MKYTGLTYRPPYEANSLLLQVTSGCSHNRCAFCTMYRDVPFETETLEQVEADLKEAQRYVPEIDRVFLENGDPFCLPAERLLAIAEMIHRYLPRVDTIAMYASIRNIRQKTDQELKELRAAGINELNIGVESGRDETLRRMQKGFTAEESLQALLRLKEAGIDYGANVILGAGGAGNQRENAIATAELLNAAKPYILFTGTMHPAKGCPLYDDLQSGDFKENTFGEYLEEEKILFSHLDLEGCFYFGLHPSNVLRTRGWLNREKDRILSEIDRRREQLAPVLDQHPVRHGEGAILI